MQCKFWTLSCMAHGTSRLPDSESGLRRPCRCWMWTAALSKVVLRSTTEHCYCYCYFYFTFFGQLSRGSAAKHQTVVPSCNALLVLLSSSRGTHEPRVIDCAFLHPLHVSAHCEELKMLVPPHPSETGTFQRGRNRVVGRSAFPNLP